MKKLLYIGNHLKTQNPTTLDLLSDLLKVEGFQVVIYSGKKNKLLRLVHMCFGVLKNYQFDCILIDTYSTTNFYYALVVSQLARFIGIRYIPILHGGNLPLRLQRNPKLSQLIFKNSFINIAPSNYLRSEFQQRDFKTQFIPNAIELKKYKFKERKILQPKLLWVRAFDAIYNPLMAIEVLELLKKNYPNATLCMIGPNKDGTLDTVKQIAKEKGVLNAIEFTGYLTKEEWIQKSAEFDIFINTSNIDNTPVSVLEAMAVGLPVVSTNVGGVPYFIEDGMNGYLVEKNNAVQMVAQIKMLIAHPKQVSGLTKKARQLVENFDVEVVKQQWRELLK